MCHEDCPRRVSGGDHLQERHLTLEVEHANLPLFTVAPEEPPRGGVLIIHDIFGPGVFYQDLARRLALEGYLVALPDFFFRSGPMPEDRDAARARGQEVVQSSALLDMQTALLWLQNQGVPGIAVLGMCWGGTMTMLAGSAQPTPQAVIPFYGFPVRERTPNAQLLPIDADQITALRTPMLAFWGDQDHAVGMDHLRTYDQALNEADREHEFVVYPGLGHAFLTFDDGAPGYAESQDAWQRTLTFLHERLGR